MSASDPLGRMAESLKLQLQAPTFQMVQKGG
jgi:hypothetical protein